ncbi:Fc.00g081920.m01.CDS01 [Cosmosporella sp. VM-42]
MATFNHAATPPVHFIQPTPASILDFFIPGFTGISAASEQLLKGNLNFYARVLCIFGIFVFLANHVYSYLREVTDTHLTASVRVQNSNEAYDMLITWVAAQPFAQEVRSSLARVGRRRMDTESHGTDKKPIKYSPWDGSFYFFYKNQLICFRSSLKDVGYRKEEEISVSCFGRSPKILKELLSECRHDYLRLIEKKTSCFENRNGDWKRTSTRDVRPLETVILNKEVKESILEDIESFLNPDSRKWYSDRGIPYRRGYLLYGPPGTGKSSFSVSIAGRFDLDIYILNLSGINDDTLSSLFAELPMRCVVLLEDVDAVHMSQRREVEKQGVSHPDAEPASRKSPSEGGVSLSGLLNALDGVSSHEGRILIMTTNHIDRLDAALIRAGRADRKVKLPNADKDMASQLFCMVFKQPATDDDKVEVLANEFAGKVPALEFSPAEIQSYLLERRDSLDTALKGVEEWVTGMREEKKKRGTDESTTIPRS